MRRAFPAVTIAVLVLTATSGLAHGIVLGTWVGSLPMSQQFNLGEEDCVAWEACPALRGLLYDDINISEAMDRAEAHMADHGTDYVVRYEVRDMALSFALTSWMVCEYDGDHRLLDCDQTYVGATYAYHLIGAIDKDAEHLRVLLKTNPGAEYYLRIVASQA